MAAAAEGFATQRHSLDERPTEHRAPMNERLVFAAYRPPFPLSNGARIRTNRLLNGLARSFETTLVTFAHDPRSPDGGLDHRELERAVPGVEIVTVPGRGPGKRRGQLRSLMSARSWAFGRYRLPQFERALADTIGRRNPAVVHFDDLGVGQFGPAKHALSVYAPHNVEHRIAEGAARTASGARRAFAVVESRKLRLEEQQVWRQMPLCLAVSAVDAREMADGGARRVEICPNGTDEVPRLPPPRRSHDEPLRLLFVGSADYGPYERGIAWLVRHVLPRLQEIVPTAFDVVGVPPRRPVEAAGVAYVGRVPAVGGWYERCHAVVVPMFEGSGTRLKIVEAMAYGRPVVSTSLGAQGLPVAADVHYRCADDASGFVRCLADVAVQCEQGSGLMGRMLQDARSAVTPLFWSGIVERLAALYRAELDRRRTEDEPTRG
jgi:glycosyltransferase involved in cell wall biosynthesis